MAEKKISYAEATAEIEKIMAELRSDNIDVDTLAQKVKRVSELIELCKAKLHKAENDVKKLIGEE